MNKLQETIQRALKKKNTIGITGVPIPTGCFFLRDVKGPFLVVTENALVASEVEKYLLAVGKKPLLLPEKPLHFLQDLSYSREIYYERAYTLTQMARGEDYIYIMPISSFAQRIPPKELWLKAQLHISFEKRVSLEELGQKLIFMGYERVFSVEKPGEFSIRGGIVDIFSPGEASPYRVELFGDEVDSMRRFSATTQLSIEDVQEIFIGPASENIYSYGEDEKLLEKELPFIHSENIYRQQDRFSFYIRENNSVTDYIACPIFIFNEENTLVYFDHYQEDLLTQLSAAIEREEAMALEERRVLSKEELFAFLYTSSTIGINENLYSTKIKNTEEFHYRKTHRYQGNWKDFFSDALQLKGRGYNIYIYSSGEKEELIRNQMLQESFSLEKVFFHKEAFPQGFIDDDEKTAYFMESDILLRTKRRRRKKEERYHEDIDSFTDLKEGDAVVHIDYGIGIYRGVTRQDFDGIQRDFLKINYQGGDNLYIPTDKVYLIQKYVGGKPALSRLGSGVWETRKNKAKKAIEDLSKELIELYAKRANQKGFAFRKDSPWQRQFESDFIYEETDDQLQAIEDIKRDMEKESPMDRLLCGDVGVGKTEVAIRAMFKAVLDGKQVAFLVPTTILAMQHEKNLRERFKGYPVNIAGLSRLVKTSERKKIREDVTKGKVDILIGTHMILSKNIQFKDLGLFVIDEEQRFGVKHKETIRKVKTNVDTLSLSATPIPRTLNMSLGGIRDMSLMNEPPADRFPIQTYLMSFDVAKIQYAIEREIQRGGQVYYVFNRISGIEQVTDMLQKLLPNVTLTYCHGRMSEEEIQRRMMEFSTGEVDVLVSTTIIETGMDIENVNTMIIHNAQDLGLSQLYQLRGRVGRSNSVAYCYLFYPSEKILTEEASKRLETIREYTDFGSGFKIAMRDLEIRGGGNLLGADQSGYFEAIGYELYMQLLQESIATLKGEETVHKDVLIDFPLTAYFPEDYIVQEAVRVQYYKKLSKASSKEEIRDIEDELIDRFGTFGEEVENLLELSYLRHLLIRLPFLSLKYTPTAIRLTIDENVGIEPVVIDQLQKKYYTFIRFVFKPEAYLRIQHRGNNTKENMAKITEVLEDMLLWMP